MNPNNDLASWLMVGIVVTGCFLALFRFLRWWRSDHITGPAWKERRP